MRQLVALARSFASFRPNLLVPRKLADRPHNWDRVSREESMRILYERFNIRFAARRPDSDDPKLEANAHVMVLASPGAFSSLTIEFTYRLGSGKSDFLDEAAALRQDDVKSAPHKLRLLLSNLVSVCISYNGNTPLSADERLQFPEHGLALRIFFRYNEISP